MDKIAKVPHLREELDWLDQTYGVEKEGFFHQEHWQLLVAIMLSAQSTDKQVDAGDRAGDRRGNQGRNQVGWLV